MSSALTDLSQKPTEAQAIWLMNGFWKTIAKDAEKIWQWRAAFQKLDKMQTKPADCELDTFFSAKFLEDNYEPMTQLARKEAMKKIDVDNNGHMSFIEFLTWHYKLEPDAVAKSPQGSNQDAIEKAQAEVAAVSKQLAVVTDKLEAARAAEAELEAALADLKKQEDEYNERLETLDKQANDPRASVLKKSKAKNELAQAKAEDPLPLRRAKITAEAAKRKVEKERKLLEAAYDELEKKMAAAREELDRVKAAGGGGGFGALWWMERSMFDADERLPRSRQKYDHSKPFTYDPAA